MIQQSVEDCGTFYEIAGLDASKCQRHERQPPLKSLERKGTKSGRSSRLRERQENQTQCDLGGSLDWGGQRNIGNVTGQLVKSATGLDKKSLFSVLRA